MSLLKEFKEFALKGNVIDLAVAVVIGGAFGKIVSSLIEDIITPVILNPALKAAGVDQIAELSANGIKYGVFLSAVINFIVIAFSMFLVVKSINKMKKEEKEAPAVAPEPTNEEKLLGEIRDLLKK